MACDITEFGCISGELAKSAIGGAIESMAAAVSEAVGKVLASLGTMWINVGTPNLTGGGTTTTVGTPPDVAGLSTVLGYVTWVSLALMIVSLFILGAQWAMRMRRGDGGGVGKLGIILGATVLVSAAAALVSAVLPDSPPGGSSTVAFLQGSLWWYVGAAAVVSVIVGATRMAWEQRAEPGRDLLKSLFTLIVVAGASVTVIGMLVVASDAFAVWILNNATSCDVQADSACFSTNIINLLSMAALAPAGTLLVIILGLVAILASVVQIVLMVARGGMLVILTGILPLAASATNTEMGKAWFKKALGWLIAFILYKPAAAIVYATAFKLVGTDVFQDDGTGVISVLTGLMLMLIALFAMPALMRFVTPMVGAVSSGGGGLAAAAAAGGLVMLPTGAAALGRRTASHSSAGSSTAGPTGNAGTAGPTGTQGTTGGPGTAPQGGGAGATTAGAAARAGAATSGGAAAGSAAAGAAAGPAGVAAGAALGAVKAAGQAASGAASSIGTQVTGEGDGPRGSR